MIHARFASLLLAVLGIILFPPSTGARRASAKVQGIRFEENVGQVAGGALFVARQRGASVLLDDEAATLSVGGASIAMKVAGARAVKPVASERLDTKTHYLIGDRAEWHTNVASYARVTYPGVLDGVDLVFHGEDGQVEYDLVVAPGVDASKVAVEFDGADSLRVNDAGDLIVSTPQGELLHARPRVLQGERVIPASYRLAGPKAIAFAIDAYDRSEPLVIDPIVVFATYLGVGGLDSAQSLALDAAGNTFVAGSSTLSTGKGGVGFPTYLGPIPAATEGTDMFVAKLTPAGALSYVAYIGGTGADQATGLALTATGLPVIVGTTASTNMPIAGTSFRATRGGGQTDGFVAELGATGTNVLFSSYIDLACTGVGCTPHDDTANAVAISGTNVFIAGSTVAISPTTMTTALDGAYVLAFDLAVPIAPSYVRYLGGGAGASGRGIAATASGDVVVVGQANAGGMVNSIELVTKSAIDATPGTGTSGNAFLSKLDGIGGVQYATYLRGTGSAASDTARGVTLDSANNAYVVGTTASADFRTLAAFQPAAGGGATDAFVVKVNPSATGMASLVFSTYLGGSGEDGGSAVALAADGSIAVTGFTKSSTFAAKATGTLGGPQDAFLAQLGATGSTLLAAAYIGGTGEETGNGVAAKSGDLYFCGSTSSTTGVTKTPAQAVYGGGALDAFIGRITLVLPVPGIAGSPGTETPPRGEIAFTASGTTPPYTFDLAVQKSGGAITSAGVYKAGDTGDVIDVVRVTDANGSTNTIDVKVGPGVSIAPKSAETTPGGKVTFKATGGKGEPYTWTVTPSGTIGTDGVLTAPNEEKELTVQAEDSLGNKAIATASVKKSGSSSSELAVSPASATTHPRGKITFTATGGTPPYTWPTASKNGATVTADGTTAEYTASTTGPSEDSLEVKDSAGTSKTATIKVGNPLTVSPQTADVAPGGTVELKIAGGSGTYTASLATGASGGKVAGTVYTAGPTPGDDTVKVVDSAGSEATAVFHVKAPATAAPDGGTQATPEDDGCSVARGSSPWAFPLLLVAMVASAIRRLRERTTK